MENNRKGKRLILDRRLLVAVGKGYLYKLPHPKNFFYDDLDVVVTSKGEVEKVVRILHFEANTITQTANAYIRVEDLIAKARTDSKEHEKMLHRLRYVPTFSSFEAFRRYLGQLTRSGTLFKKE